MSRGIGKVQQDCLRVLRERRGELDSISIVAVSLGRLEITPAEHASYRRALRRLAKLGQVVDLGRGYRDRRRRWAVPEVAERQLKMEQLLLSRCPR